MYILEYRVENKYLVSDLDLAIIAKRLSTVMDKDIHQSGDCYEIRSAYFDDIYNTCANDNEDGVDSRKKYRIRIYDPVSSPIKLEIKEKLNGFTKKTSCSITKDEWESFLKGANDLQFGERAPMNELLIKNKCYRMKPKIIIVYERSAFVYPTGNVRITFDRNIMVSKELNSFFSKRVEGLVPILPVGMHILEVKYDEMLPDVIAKQLEIGKLRKTAFSKYYLGRLAISGDIY